MQRWEDENNTPVRKARRSSSRREVEALALDEMW
jgi:hypothetical protein